MGKGIGLLWAVLLFVDFSTACHASPWPRQPGEQFNRTEVEAFWSRSNQQHFRQFVTRDYLELGLGDRLTLGGQLAAAVQESSGPGYTVIASGVSEAQLFAILHTERKSSQRRNDDTDPDLGQDQHHRSERHRRDVHAWRLTGGVPTTKFNRGQRVMGHDAFVELSRLAGYGTKAFFAVADAGGRFSLGRDAHQLRVNGSLGFKRGEGLLLAQTFNTISLGEAEGAGTDFDLGQVSLSVVLPLRRRFKLEVGGRVDTYTRQVAPGQSLFFAMWWTI